MQVVATLHPHSPTARDWRVRCRALGHILSVPFRRQGLVYVTDPLEPADATRLQKLPFVTIEATSAPPPPPEDLPVKRGPGRPPRAAPAPAGLISDEELFGTKS